MFRQQVFFENSALGKWSNVYHVDAANITAASASMLTALPGLRGMLNTACTLTRILTSDPASDDFIEVVHNELGTNGGGGTLLPLFNSVKALIQPDNLGRPDVKFLKGLITEDMQASGLLTNVVAVGLDVIFQDMIDDMITNTIPFCSENGDLWVSVSIQVPIQMRQMHRRRR